VWLAACCGAGLVTGGHSTSAHAEAPVPRGEPEAPAPPAPRGEGTVVPDGAGGGVRAPWSGRGCTNGACHGGIEPIRTPDRPMFQAIVERGRAVGDPDGCTVCHGGDPAAQTAEAAHTGADPRLAQRGGPDGFYADPASPWVFARTCGTCHPKLARAERNSLMMTEAGKIQGTLWAFGDPLGAGYEHRYANYAAENPTDPSQRIGTETYRAYMEAKRAAHPNVFVSAHEPLPAAPGAAELAERPGLSALTYLRAECQRCHLGVRGRATRGDFRGMGCGACHMPYGNEGRYEGGDRTIDPDETGHVLVHRIQATRDAAVEVGGRTVTGIPVETCTTCHNRGKRIGVSYQGLMEAAWASPYTEGGGGQLPLHTKHYIALEKDVHYQRGMLCQDCHTSGDVHGDGFLVGANLGAVEIECSDCHGTPSAYPWELPLGWGDENRAGRPASGPPRGTARSVPEHLRRGDVGPPQDGYLLSARGNPMPDVVRVGDEVVVRTAAGKDLRLEPLKRKAERGALSPEARAAMVHATRHLETMECYACHAAWAPQCYGCHVEVDYRGGARAFDWVAAGRRHQDPAHAADPDEGTYDTYVAGKVTEMRSYLRWEDPPLGVNGEGRVSPIIPGCQPAVTVIGPDGSEVVRNHVFRTPPGTEGGGPQGQLAIDMSPVQPHTIGKARPCESCHGSQKAMGYGIPGTMPWHEPKTVDLADANGRALPAGARPQIEAVEGLVTDWSVVVTPDGIQRQTVGHHFAGSGPLSDEQRRRMDRRNICAACHARIPDGDLAVAALHHAAEALGRLPEARADHERVVRGALRLAAWAQVLAAAGVGGLAIGGLFVALRRRRRKG